MPGMPMPFVPGDKWDVRHNSTDYGSWATGQPMDAQHGPDCAPPPAVHHIDNWMAGPFICNDHLMTAVNAGTSYGAEWLVPDVMVDLSSTATIGFDVSTLALSGRDWIDLNVSPVSNFMTLGCDSRCPAYDGLALNAIHVRHDGDGWILTVEKNGLDVADADFYDPVENTAPSAVIRTHYELRITPTSVTFGEPGQNASVTVNVGPNFTQGIVQWGHHSYNPTKDGAGVPGTWHWDNFSIAPAIPMPFDKGDVAQKIGNAGQSFTVNFERPAPAGARLAFNAVCTVGLNWGSGYTTAKKVLGDNPKGPETGHAYFEPVPAGATSVQVQFSGDGWYDGVSWPCLFEDPVLYQVG
jgi:hypothetical protein